MQLGSAHQLPFSDRSGAFRQEARPVQASLPDGPVRVQGGQTSYDLHQQLPSRHTPLQQRAIGFYELTANLTHRGGDGELIGVDTYA